MDLTDMTIKDTVFNYISAVHHAYNNFKPKKVQTVGKLEYT